MPKLTWYIIFSLTAVTCGIDATPENIKSLNENSSKIYRNFYSNFQISILFNKYDPALLSADEKSELIFQAERASRKLSGILKEQEHIKKHIEEYEGGDWEEKFGNNNLWKEISANVLSTNYRQMKIDLELSSLVTKKRKEKLLENTLENLNRFEKESVSAFELLRAKIYMQMAEVDSSYRKLAKNQLFIFTDTLSENSRYYYRAVIEKLKFEEKPKELFEFITSLKDKQKNNLSDQTITGALIFLEDRIDTSKIISLAERRKKVLGFYRELKLRKLKSAENYNEFKKKDVQIALEEILKQEPGKFRSLLKNLIEGTRFDCAGLYYAGALAEKSLEKRFEYLIRATELLEDSRLNLNIDHIIEFLIDTGYALAKENRLSDKNTNQLMVLLENFDLSDSTVFSIGKFLNDIGKLDIAFKILKKIDENENAEWLILKIKAEKNYGKAINRKIEEFIAECDNKDLKNKAKTLLAERLLDSKNKRENERATELLKEIGKNSGKPIKYLKIKSLRKRNKYQKAVEEVLEIEDINEKLHYEIIQLLDEIYLRIDEFEALNQSDKFYQDCAKIADRCLDLKKGEKNLIEMIYVAEFNVYSDFNRRTKTEKISKIRQKLNKIKGNYLYFIETKARVLTYLKEFTEASVLWKKARKARENEPSDKYERNWRWWRAKYFELNCILKMPAVEKNKVLHAVEVLINSYEEIPDIWRRKLSDLKKGN